MSLYNYDYYWTGIDSGREGLWKEPVWSGVLKIISRHEGERVYNEKSPIYEDLEEAHPGEAWRSWTAEGAFRPLFRDYPNSWTRSGVASLANQTFCVTALGANVLRGATTKADVLVSMFLAHEELVPGEERLERPFSILATALIESPRGLSTEEIYWAVMKNYRPKTDSLAEVLKAKLPKIARSVEPTPYRRLRNMLTLMRTAGAIESHRRRHGTYWSPLDIKLLNLISQQGK